MHIYQPAVCDRITHRNHRRSRAKGGGLIYMPHSFLQLTEVDTPSDTPWLHFSVYAVPPQLTVTLTSGAQLGQMYEPAGEWAKHLIVENDHAHKTPQSSWLCCRGVTKANRRKTPEIFCVCGGRGALSNQDTQVEKEDSLHFRDHVQV